MNGLTSTATHAAATRRHPGGLAAAGHWVLQFPARLLVGLIRVYQRILSPVLPVITLGRCGCRFSPTCSHYAAEAIQNHGAFRGVFLGLVRLVKCTPLHPGGFDPVPARRARPVCGKAEPALPTFGRSLAKDATTASHLRTA